ncbi:hypothetical protein IAR55_000620 [Kwoniella newhampshirensis]|uniref:RNI-like protein n=1 Tax=Kwoniella newhampshirensis TaxID=1651941 RepID=A0AAW0Z786_9TREE
MSEAALEESSVSPSDQTTDEQSKPTSSPHDEVAPTTEVSIPSELEGAEPEITVTSSTPPVDPTTSVALADSSQPPSTPSASASNPLPPVLAAPAPAPSPSPARRRPKPPTKGILKPPPPPARPTFGNRLRDIVGGAVTAVGTTTRLFDAPADPNDNAAGPSTPYGNTASRTTGVTEPNSTGLLTTNSAPSGTLASIGSRLGGLGMRFVASATGSPTPSTASTPGGSPLPSRSISLPDPGSPVPRGGNTGNGPGGVAQGGSPMMSEKSRQKQPLKRATFVLPTLSITYPISSQGEPWSVKVIEDRKRIETTHRSLLCASTGPEYWTAARLVSLYESACRGREERSRVGIVRALEVIPAHPRHRSIHLTLRIVDHTTIGQTPTTNTLDAPFNRHSAEAFADVLSAEWGLFELKLEGGLIESEDALKPILHALLISGTLPVLGLAGNKKIKPAGWRLLAVFLKRARSLKFVDLSDTTWDKKGVEYLVQALNRTHVQPHPVQSTSASQVTSPDPSHNPPPPPPSKDENEKNSAEPTDANGGAEGEEKACEDAYGSFIPPAPLLKENDLTSTPAAVQTIRMDGCGLKANVLETLAQGIRSSDLKNLSLRRNRIGPLGAVALALMIRDYPDSLLTMSSLSPSLNNTSPFHQPPVPLDPTTTDPTTQTPYVARARRGQSTPVPNGEERDLPPIPLVVSSPAGGITSRTLPEGYKPPPPPKHPLVMPGGGNSTMQDAGNFPVTHAIAEGKISTTEIGGASMALQRSVRALDGVERIGKLLTLDLKSNEIRNGVGYIAQVLKRNRTLKVLNLSDNQIGPSGLTAIAEALKYNSTLETLDLSSNPCCGPPQEGIAALRTTFTVNTSLKRLFLSDTGLTTDGAISLAEFLPESKSLLHLDVTSNPAVETAGILAISVGLKSNSLIRCLDVSIPPDNSDLADLSQNILQCCIRNTELAAEVLAKEGGKGQDAIWGPIKKSELVRQVKEADEARAEKERLELAQSPEGVAREYVYTLKPAKVVTVSEDIVRDLQKWLEAKRVFQRSAGGSSRGGHAWEPGQLPKEDWGVLYERAKVLRERIVEQIQETTDGALLERLLGLNDSLQILVEEKGKGFDPPPRLLLPSQIVPTDTTPQPRHGHSHRTAQTLSPSPAQPPNQGRFPTRRHMRISSIEIQSPNFSIGDSDGDSDAEEVDVGQLGTTATTSAVNGHGRARASSGSNRPLSGLGLVVSSNHDPKTNHGQDEGMMEKELEHQAQIEQALLDDLTSPVEKASRAWVEEEGEIFRKGMKLGVMEDDEEGVSEDVTGEELRQEILDTPVERSPTRRVIPVEEKEGDEVEEGEGAKEAAQ